MTDHSAMDAFHAKVLRDCQTGLQTGEVEELPPTTRWRLEYLCNHCAHLHAVTGTYQQMHLTVGIFMMLGYPLLTVKEEGYAVLVDLEGLDLSNQEDLAASAELYQGFCDETRD